MIVDHRYSDSFFDWVDVGACRSARRLLPFLRNGLEVNSVVDVGCGTGSWLSEWSGIGVTQILGVDGNYVRRDRLKIGQSEFVPVDLGGEWNLDRRFDLAQSLEVAEHLPPAAGPDFIGKLCRLADVVLFSAAQPGQGGEHHVNERPLDYWRAIFEENGFHAFDVVRPRFRADMEVEPWYRYNVLLYANAAGRARLSTEFQAVQLPIGQSVPAFGDWTWELRKLLLRPLSVSTVTALSRLHYHIRNALRGADGQCNDSR